jgi:hypothetical protein
MVMAQAQSSRRTGRDIAQHRAANPARATALTLAVAWIGLTVGLGYIDGTNLFAPLNWVDAGYLPHSAASQAWSTILYAPLLVLASVIAAHRVVSGAGRGTRTGWIFGAVWSTIILVAFGVKLIYSLIQLLIAGTDGLRLWPTLGALLAVAGVSAAKYAVLGMVLAAPATLAHGIRARRGNPDEAPPAEDARARWSPVWFLAGAMIAGNVADASYGWLQGSLRPFLLPIAGAIGSWACARLLWTTIPARLLTSSLRGRESRGSIWARSSLTVTASAIGFLLPWLVDGLIAGFGGGWYPLMGAFFSIATGVIAGAWTSLFGLLWAGLARVPGLDWLVPTPLPEGARRAPRIVGRVAGYVTALTLAIGVLLPTSSVPRPVTVPNGQSSDAGWLLPLFVRREAGKTPVIADSAGRQVLLRGVNVNQLIDYGQPDPNQPTVLPLTETDYAEMATVYGFNVQRLSLSWSALEPTRGQLDQAYLARVRTAVNRAARQGIYTVLDMHQDTYSKYIGTAPGSQCRELAAPVFGNDGAPEWATVTDGARGCGFLGRDLAPNIAQAFTNLYYDTEGIATALADTWGRVVREFAADTAIAGYDLLNEPGPGNTPGITSGLLLGRVYDKIITAIRESESKTPNGYPHLIFFEPSILWSGLGFDVSPPVGFTSDQNLVFSPHLYNESISMDQGLGLTLTTMEQGYELALRAAASYDVPLWSGEWGWFGDVDAHHLDKVHRFLSLQNAHLLGSAVWVWKKACGDPQIGRTDEVAGEINLVACPSGSPLPRPAGYTAALAQAYPRAAPGRLTSLSSSPTTLYLYQSGTGTGVLDVWVPGTTRPTIESTGLTAIVVAAGQGGFRLTASANGDYALTLR